MAKRKQEVLGDVLFDYVGTDHDFDIFLKMLLHDYLSIDQSYMLLEQKSVDKVESDVA